MWYKNGVPRIKNYHLAWYDMTRDGSCFDESFFEPDEVDKVIPYVETVEDEGKNDRSKVFVHFDDGDMYELKLAKVDKDERQRGYFCDECGEDDEDDYKDDYIDSCTNEYESETMKFIWGVKSWDDLCDSDACLYTMNDIDLIYLKDEDKYILSIETMFQFDKEEYKLDYLKRCLDAFTKFMADNGYNINVKPYWMDVFTYGWNMNTHFDSIEDCYAMFKLLVNGYCS